MGLRLRSVAAAIFALAAFDTLAADFSATFFREARQLRQASRIPLSRMAPADWEKACYYGPYAVEAKLGIDNADGDWTLVFIAGGGEVGRIQGTDRRLVLRANDGACYARAGATLVWQRDHAVLRMP